ncbi:uncharacterized protein [Dysidea avara]|uniref:uncharacterized protein isoform X1 n=1 Tax=Dysidea avara TaxID=196820 RepID=UPI0033281A42
MDWGYWDEGSGAEDDRNREELEERSYDYSNQLGSSKSSAITLVESDFEEDQALECMSTYSYSSDANNSEPMCRWSDSESDELPAAPITLANCSDTSDSDEAAADISKHLKEPTSSNPSTIGYGYIAV